MTRNLKPMFEKLIDDLSLETDERYKDYLLSRPRTLVHENLIFDLEHLDSFFNCQGCRRRKRKAFCCADHDVELTGRDIAMIEKRLPAVITDFPRLGRLVEKKGFWEWGENFEKMIRRKNSGDCLFLMPGGAGCYLHAWALTAGRDPFEIKPYICSLFPLVVIVIGDDVVITTLNRDSAQILDCGGQVTPCTERRGRGANHALRQSRELLIRMFGERVYQKVCRQALGK